MPKEVVSLEPRILGTPAGVLQNLAISKWGTTRAENLLDYALLRSTHAQPPAVHTYPPPSRDTRKGRNGLQNPAGTDKTSGGSECDKARQL